MGIKDKVKQMVGGAKEKAGEGTDNERRSDSGNADKASGEMGDKVDEPKDKAAGGMKDAKDKFDGDDEENQR